MNSEQFDEKAVFNAARQIASATARDEYLAQACGDNPSAIERVRELLRIHGEEQSFLESPAAGLSPTTDLCPIAEHPGTVIGSYKLLQQIGEGGMGVVFMAEQSHPLQRTVALKIIKPGMDTRQVIARFEAERQAVAMMDHPNIAKVLDAGTTNSGRPYFVMELVKGVPVTRYCDEKHLPLRARLELFVQVCQAVQHAHQKGIIHRDIKPNNVLVAEYDNHAVPKIIDFGVAKATAQRLTERTMFTEFGQVLGTMEYMSPEQSKFNQLDIDTRTDIYSLGVLLYELLAGSTPFERKRLHEAAFDEMLRIIREEEPPSPSTRLSSSDILPSLAASRNTEPAKLSRQVRGELDWVVMKALEKDRGRRYETANGLSKDIERFLNDEAVTARPTSSIYRFGKLVRRNRIAFATAAAIAAVIVLGSVVSTWQAIRATRSENEQVRLREVAEEQRTLATTAAERERKAAEQERQARDAAVQARLQTTLQLADNFTARGLEDSESRLNGRAALWFANAAVIARDDPGRTQANQIRMNNWQRSQLTPVAAVEQPFESCDQLVFDPANSRYLITYQRFGTVEAPPQILDLATEQALPRLTELGPLGDAVWAPNGRVLLGTSRSQVILASMPDLSVVQEWNAGSAVRRVAASPNGQFVAAAAGNKLLVWKVSGEAEPATFEHQEGIVHIAFSPTGVQLVTATEADDAAHLFAVESDEAASPRLRKVLGPVTHRYRGEMGDYWTRPPVFVDAGRQLVTTHNFGSSGAIKWYDTASGEELATSSSLLSRERGGAQVSPDGSLLVVAGYQGGTSTTPFDTKTRQSKTRMGNALAMAFSPNGRYFALSAIDMEIRSVQQGQIGNRALPFLGNGGTPAFSNDGNYLATLRRGLTQVWQLPAGKSSFRRVPHNGKFSWAAFSPDGQYVASIGRTTGPSTIRAIQVRETATGNSAGQALLLDANLIAADFSPDGVMMAAVTGVNGDPAQLRIWNWRTGSLVGKPYPLEAEPVWTCFAPDGKSIAVHCMNGQVILVDPPSGTQLMYFTCDKPRRTVGTYPWATGRGTIGFSHDGNTLFTWGGPVVQAWDRATGRERWAVSHPPDCWSLAESPDGRIIATGSYDGVLRFWDGATGHEARPPIEHPDQVLTIAFSPDGRLVGTACRDWHTRVWEVATGKLVCSMSSNDYLTDLRFTPDGRFAISADARGLRAWNLEDGYPISPVLSIQAGALPTLDISADGHWALVSGDADQFGVIDLQMLTETAQGSPEAELGWAELVSNTRVNVAAIVDLNSTEWLDRWREFRRKHPEFRPFEQPVNP